MRPSVSHWLGLAAVVLSAHFTGTVSQTPATPFDSVATTTYDVAGVRVIHRVVPTSGVVAVRLLLLGGTRQLTPETEGIEALLLEAAAAETQRAMALAGARAFVEPAADWTATGFVALRSAFADAWSIFADWFEHIPPANGAIERARNSLLSDARRRASHPDLRIHTIARLVAFRDHPYALSPQGTERALSALTAQDLERYARGHLVRSRLLLVIVGNVPRSIVEPLVASTLGQLPLGSYSWTPPPPIPVRESSWLAEHRQLPTNYILGYFIGPEPTHPDYYAFRIATELLSSRLNRVIRMRRSLSYAAYAAFLDRAIPVGGVYASTPDPAEVYDLMAGQIINLRQFDLSYRALRDFVDQFTFDQVAEQMSIEMQAEALSRSALYFGDFRMADEGWKQLRRVSARAVRLAVEKYVTNLQLAYLGDTTLMSGKW